MYSQDYSHYQRPDVSNVTWLTPQQVDAIRLNSGISLRPVNVLEARTPSRRQKLAVEFADPQAAHRVDVTQLQAEAPRLVQLVLQNGWAKIVVPDPAALEFERRQREQTYRRRQRARWTPERRRKAATFMRRFWKQQKANA